MDKNKTLVGSSRENTSRAGVGRRSKGHVGTALVCLTLLAGMAHSQSQLSSTVSRTVKYEYDAYGQLVSETLEPGNAQYEVKTVYERAPVGGVDFGLASKKTLTWTDPSGAAQSRMVESTSYDSFGRFVLVKGNAKGQTVTSSYDDGSGAVLSMLDTNGLQSTWQYDGWGRLLLESHADGTAVSKAYRQCVDSCAAAVSVVVTQHWMGTSQISVPSEDFTDVLGRGVFSRSWGFDASPVITEKAFDGLGYTQAVARPHFQGAAAQWTYYDRDDIGRVIQIRSPKSDGSGYDLTLYAYDGRVLTSTNAKGQQRVQESNALGKIKSITDALGQVTTYVYDGWGNLTRARDPKGNQIDVNYDRLGRKTQLSDPDLGVTQYAVDALGQTWQQQDAKGQVTSMTYDELGRMTRRLEADQDSRWDYDSAAHGVGLLAEAYTVRSDGTKDYRRAYAYDGLSRPQRVTISLDWDYVADTLYDGFGRAYQHNYTRRTRDGSGGVTTSVYNTFNAQGYVDKTYRLNDGLAVQVWQGVQADAEGRFIRSQLGGVVQLQQGYNTYTGRLEAVIAGPSNGNDINATLQNDVYQYDVIGNLSYRAQLGDNAALLQESFEYDPLNRLSRAQLGAQDDHFTYDELGNLASKAHVGSYSYPASGAGSARPHAVSDVAGTVAGVSNPHFAYDANGNLLSGINRSYNWTAADQPSSIDRFDRGFAVQRTEWVYGPDHERVLQRVRGMRAGVPQSATDTEYYAGAIQKEIDVAANVTIIRTSLGDLGYVEERINGTTIAPDQAGTRNARLFLKDHLGSVIGVIDETGAVLQRLSYDAWGRRRNTNGSDDDWGSLGTIRNTQDHSGYTGHEQLDQLGLVDMNARLYDPITGRHVSADPTVPDPSDLQAFNHYTYVLNNALAFVDPTGLSPEQTVFASLTNPWGLQPNQVKDDILCRMDSWCNSEKLRSLDDEAAKQAQLKAQAEACKKSPESCRAGKPSDAAQGVPELRAEAPNFFVDNWAGRVLANMVAPVALFTPDNVNPLTGYVENFNGNKRAEAAIGLLTLGVGSEARAETAVVKELATASRAWRLGDDIYALVKGGAEAAWSTVRSRFWKNEAAAEGAAEKYGAENLERMRSGRAPQRFNPDKGGRESMELSHEPVPARDGGKNVVPRWPQDHATVDPFRRPGY